MPDKKLAEAAVEALGAKALTLSAAESMTGGAFTKAVTDIAGASAVLNSSYVTYTEKEKIRILGVRPATLKEHTAVSKEVALEMARGLHRLCGSDVCVSVTGYAGPSGDDIGLFFIGLYSKGHCRAFEYRARRYGRSYIRKFAVRKMLELVLGCCLPEI